MVPLRLALGPFRLMSPCVQMEREAGQLLPSVSPPKTGAFPHWLQRGRDSVNPRLHLRCPIFRYTLQPSTSPGDMAVTVGLGLTFYNHGDLFCLCRLTLCPRHCPHAAVTRRDQSLGIGRRCSPNAGNGIWVTFANLLWPLNVIIDRN